jgi:hypothetical protein
MIAGKAAGVIDNLAAHAELTAISDNDPCLPSTVNHEAYLPLVEKYILLEEALHRFFAS